MPLAFPTAAGAGGRGRGAPSPGTANAVRTKGLAEDRTRSGTVPLRAVRSVDPHLDPPPQGGRRVWGGLSRSGSDDKADFGSVDSPGKRGDVEVRIDGAKL